MVKRMIGPLAAALALLGAVAFGLFGPHTVTGTPEAAPVVECWESLVCSDGSTLEDYECGETDYWDVIQHVWVHSNGICETGMFSHDVPLDTSQVHDLRGLPDAGKPTETRWTHWK